MTPLDPNTTATEGSLSPTIVLDHAYRLQVAKEAALAAGNIQKQHYGSQITIETKSSGIDLVTAVDIACDEAITEILTRAFPQDTLITEETFQGTDFKNFSFESTWIVDPLDGTTNFAHSFPHFAVSIAYVENGEATIGVIYDMSKDELFYAVKDQGAFMEKPMAGTHSVPIKTSNVSELSLSLLATGFPYDIATNPGNSLNYLSAMLKASHGVRRPGAAALDLAYVAAGRLDGFWEITLSPWDLAAGIVLVQEAGGACQNLQSQPIRYQNRRIDIAAANSSHLLAQMQTVLSDTLKTAV